MNILAPMRLTLNAIPLMTSSVLAANGGDAICDVIVGFTGTELPRTSLKLFFVVANETGMF
jgi:hypothetical protein